MILKSRLSVHHPEHFDDPLDPVEISDLLFQGRQHIDTDQTGGLVGLVLGTVHGYSSHDKRPIGLVGAMPGHEHQVSDRDSTDVIAERCRGSGKRD